MEREAIEDLRGPAGFCFADRLSGATDRKVGRQLAGSRTQPYYSENGKTGYMGKALSIDTYTCTRKTALRYG